jgi:hypothetical protein
MRSLQSAFEVEVVVMWCWKEMVEVRSNHPFDPAGLKEPSECNSNPFAHR